jgi:hypothetical protein
MAEPKLPVMAPRIEEPLTERTAQPAQFCMWARQLAELLPDTSRREAIPFEVSAEEPLLRAAPRRLATDC